MAALADAQQEVAVVRVCALLEAAAALAAAQLGVVGALAYGPQGAGAVQVGEPSVARAVMQPVLVLAQLLWPQVVAAGAGLKLRQAELQTALSLEAMVLAAAAMRGERHWLVELLARQCQSRSAQHRLALLAWLRVAWLWVARPGGLAARAMWATPPGTARAQARSTPMGRSAQAAMELAQGLALAGVSRTVLPLEAMLEAMALARSWRAARVAELVVPQEAAVVATVAQLTADALAELELLPLARALQVYWRLAVGLSLGGWWLRLVV